MPVGVYRKKNKKGKEKLRPHFSKVSFDLKPIQKEAIWDGVLQPESEWAYPHWGSCQIAMRQCFENYGLCSGQAKKLKKWVIENFDNDKINKNIVESLYGYNIDEFEDWLSELNSVEEIE